MTMLFLRKQHRDQLGALARNSGHPRQVVLVDRVQTFIYAGGGEVPHASVDYVNFTMTFEILNLMLQLARLDRIVCIEELNILAGGVLQTQVLRRRLSLILLLEIFYARLPRGPVWLPPRRWNQSSRHQRSCIPSLSKFVLSGCRSLRR